MESEDKTSADVREGNPPAPTKSEEPKAPTESGAKPAEGEPKPSDRPDANKKSAKEKCSKKHSKHKAKKAKKAASPAESASDSDSDDDADGTSSSSSSDDSQSEAEDSKKKRVAKKRQDPQKAKRKTRTKKQKRATKTQDPSDSDSDSDSSDSDASEGSEDEANQRTQADLAKQLRLLLLQQQQQQQQQGGGSYQYATGLNNSIPTSIYDTGLRHTPPRPRRGIPRSAGRANLNLGGLDPNLLLDGKQQQKDKKKRQKATKLDYKRVDQVWDDSIHNYKLQDTAEGTVDAKYEEFIFHVRRTFDWEGKYKATIVDIKSKLLRECLQDVIGDIKGVSLVDDTPKLDPNMLFL
jgi:hypothetical protein